MSSVKSVLPAAVLAVHLGAMAADPVRMQFEGLTLDVGGTRSDVAVSDYYNGGSSKDLPTGTTPVVTGPLPALGIAFAGAAVTETAAAGGESPSFGLTRELLLADGTVVPSSNALGVGVVYALAGNAFSLSVDPALVGFNDALSFFYNANSDLQVSVLTSTGPLAGVTFSSTGLCAGLEPRCKWVAASLSFAGTLTGVQFTGSDFALDNLTLGQVDPYGPLLANGGGNGGNGGGGNGNGNGGGVVPPGPVEPIPEPSTYALMALGLGLVAWATRRKQRVA